RDVEKRERAQLDVAVTDEVAERGVDRRDPAIETGERHAGLRLLEKGTEAGLALVLGRLGAQLLADIGDERQLLVAPGGQPMNGHIERHAPARLRDHRRRVACGSLLTG